MKPFILIFALAILFSSCGRKVKEEGIRLGDYDKMEQEDSIPDKNIMPDSATVNTIVVDSAAIDTVRVE